MILKKSDNNYYPSLLLTVIAVTVYWSLKDDAAQLTVFAGCSLQQALLYHFAHVNIFHLAANIMALWTFHPRWMTVTVAYVVSTITALLLSLIPGYGPVCGLSAFLFACFARRYATWHTPVWNIILVNAVFFFIPGIDAAIHLLSFFISYFVWKAVATYRERQHS